MAVRRTDDDILLFYFAGHGFIHEDPSGQRQVYLATSDLDAHLIQEGEDIESISLDWLRERLYEKTKAGRVLLILDCCYAGNMGRIPGDLPLNTIFDLFKHYLGATNDVSLRKYRVTIAATGHDAEASEKNDHSMTNHLLAVLRGECHEVLSSKGEVTIGRLYDYLYQIMPAEQKPSFSGDTAGRGLVLATYPEYSDQALRTQQWASQREERRERLQILTAAPDGERFLRDRLESFVGRETELHDIQQRIAAVQPSGGYVTITGQAGQGKSSVIAALIARYASTSEEREHISFHFIPFNPGPEYQVTLLRNLMARLILKYDLSDLYVASESRPALCDFFPKVLSDVSAKGGQEMIFIDGLDQIESDSNGIRDLSFLPTNPPEGIIFVLGTRPDDTLKPLTLLKPTQSYLLPSLSREDFSILLQRRQVPSLEPGLADQFYEKMQRNALYLDLLARELHNQGSITHDAIETIIRRLAENPNNIFSLALERLERRGDWHEVVKPLLGVLLVTYEPLTPWQLRTILNLDHQQIQNGLQCLSGLVTHIEQRYALYHLKFQDFLREDEARPDKPCIFATDEEVGYHARIVQWCERDQLSTIWEDTSDSNEQRWRVYVRHHYISHLYASRQWERLFATLDERSYGQGKERYDVGARSYIQDLKKGCLAATGDGWTDEQHLKYLSRHWRYTLLRCSIRSTADQYPLDLFKVMLILGKEREVAGLIELITIPGKKVETLLLLAQHLAQSPERQQERSAIYLRSEEVARSIEDASQQVQALMALATALAQAQQWESAKRILSQVEKVVRSIENTSRQGRALTALATILAQAQQWRQAEEVTRSIEDTYEQGRALTALATALAQAQQWESAKRILSQAEEVIRSIENTSRRAEALTALATVLVQAQQWESAKRILSQAEEVTHSIENTSRRDRALTALVTALAQAQQWRQAEVVARSIEDTSRREGTDGSCHRTGSSPTVEAGRGSACSIKDTSQQAEALTALATALAQAQQWRQAEEVARSIQDTSRQAGH